MLESRFNSEMVIRRVTDHVYCWYCER